MEGVYLIHTREFIKSDETIYKLGRSFTLDNRVKQYPNGSKILLMIACEKSIVCESKLIEIFKNKFIQKKYYGNEYFEGDYKLMIKEIFNYIDKMNIENIEKDKKDKIEKAVEKKKNKEKAKAEKEKAEKAEKADKAEKAEEKIEDKIEDKIEEKINNNSNKICPKCNYEFDFPSRLKKHFTNVIHCKKTDLEIKEYFLNIKNKVVIIKCKYCNKEFSRKDSLNRHIKIQNCKENKSNFLK